MPATPTRCPAPQDVIDSAHTYLQRQAEWVALEDDPTSRQHLHEPLREARHHFGDLLTALVPTLAGSALTLDLARAVTAVSSPAPAPGAEAVTVPAPRFGTETGRAAQFLVDAAWKLRAGFEAGGSTVRDGIATLLEDVAAQLDPAARTTYGGQAPHTPLQLQDISTMSFEQRQQLPAIYHRPVFNDLGRPTVWMCAVCWDDDAATVTPWPCLPAQAGGRDLARYLGLEYTS